MIDVRDRTTGNERGVNERRVNERGVWEDDGHGGEEVRRGVGQRQCSSGKGSHDQSPCLVEHHLSMLYEENRSQIARRVLILYLRIAFNNFERKNGIIQGLYE